MSSVENKAAIGYLIGKQNTWLMTSGGLPNTQDFYSGDARSNDCVFLAINNVGTPRLVIPKLIIGAREGTAAFNAIRRDVVKADGQIISRFANKNGFIGGGSTDEYSKVDVVVEDSTAKTADVQSFCIINGVKQVRHRAGHLEHPFTFQAKQQAADPIAAELADGFGGLFKNTTSAAVFLAYNDGGVIKKVALV